MLVVARQNGFYGEAFRTERGATQGGVSCPSIFNIVVDCIVRHWFKTSGISKLTVREALLVVYADDRLLSGRDAEWTQRAFNNLVSLFERMGLQTNETKTKAMICYPGYISGPIAPTVYKRVRTGDALTYTQRKRRKVTCPHPGCNASLVAGSIPSHMQSQHQTFPVTLPPQPSQQPAATYTLTWPATASRCDCPVDGCSTISARHATSGHAYPAYSQGNERTPRPL